jgi:predicted  nucleic acid-binding Zn-ribbon protein
MFFQCDDCGEIFLLYVVNGMCHPSCPTCSHDNTKFLNVNKVKNILNNLIKEELMVDASDLELMLEIKAMADTLEQMKKGT